MSSDNKNNDTRTKPTFVKEAVTITETQHTKKFDKILQKTKICQPSQTLGGSRGTRLGKTTRGLSFKMNRVEREKADSS